MAYARSPGSVTEATESPRRPPRRDGDGAERMTVERGRRVRWLDAGILLVLLWPGVLLLENPTWIFTNPYELPWFDPWIFLGYFHYYPDYIVASPDYYPGERLPWILPGYLVYHLLAPVEANYVLHLGCYWAATLALYATLRELFDRQSALLTTLCFGAYAGFLMAVGWDWVDGPAIAYSLIASYFLTLAARRERWRRALVLAGVASAGMVFSHTMTTALLPAYVVYYVLMDRRFGRRPLVRSALWYGLGFVGLVAVLGAVNRAMGGAFLFFQSQLRVVSLVLTSPGETTGPRQWSWTTDEWGWLMYVASWASIPLATGILSIAHLVQTALRGGLARSGDPEAADARFVRAALAAQYACMVAVFAVLHLRFHAVFAFHFDTSFILPGMALVAGAFFSWALGTLPRSRGVALVASAIPILAVALVPALGSRLQTLVGAGYGRTSVFLPGAIVVAGVLLVLAAGRRLPALVVCLCCMSLANATVANQRQYSLTSTRDRTDGFRAIVKAIRVFHELNTDGRLGLWLDTNEEPLGQNVFWATWIASHPRIGPFRSRDYPPGALANFDPATVSAGARVALVSARRDAVATAQAALHAHGLGARVTDRRSVRRGSIRFTITLLELHEAPSGGPTTRTASPSHDT